MHKHFYMTYERRLILSQRLYSISTIDMDSCIHTDLCIAPRKPTDNFSVLPYRQLYTWSNLNDLAKCYLMPQFQN